MTAFGGNGSDLAAMIAYERDALEFIRAALFDQTETASHSLELNLSEAKNLDGFYRRHITLNLPSVSFGAGAVRSALSRLRPLAFSATFKIQDMIAEWVLRTNGSSAWSFSEKIADYDRMKTAGTLTEPAAFANKKMVSDAFWGLYKALTPFRNKIIHKNSFTVVGNTLTISADGRALSLSDKKQGSYIRATCLTADALINNKEIEGVSSYIVENDLRDLSNIHNVVGLKAQSVRTASVTAVALGHLNASGYTEVDVDFDEIKRNAEATFPPGPTNILLYELVLVVEADNRQMKWVFPPGALPVGRTQVAENDPSFDPYRN